MNLQTRKLNFIEELLRVTDEKIISKLEGYLKEEKKKIYEKELKPMRHKDFYEMIDQSLKDSKEGRVISNSDLKKKIKSWK